MHVQKNSILRIKRTFFIVLCVRIGSPELLICSYPIYILMKGRIGRKPFYGVDLLLKAVPVWLASSEPIDEYTSLCSRCGKPPNNNLLLLLTCLFQYEILLFFTEKFRKHIIGLQNTWLLYPREKASLCHHKLFVVAIDDINFSRIFSLFLGGGGGYE